ncbi:MAG: hypothetical protein BroJett013_15410 [Alphaproteobacteria bacterium]|nr:MAG: hypothetical protein BroJett013_15410 [Alphaproteobacteria bacterium]
MQRGLAMRAVESELAESDASKAGCKRDKRGDEKAAQTRRHWPPSSSVEGASEEWIAKGELSSDWAAATPLANAPVVSIMAASAARQPHTAPRGA